MHFISCMFIGIVLSIVIAYLIGKIMKRNIVIKSKYKYYFVSFCISVLIGVFVFSLLDYNKYTIISGMIWGLLDGFMQTFFIYEKD